MKRLNIFFIIIFFNLAVFAQDRDAMRKIESARIGMITERLGLTPEQAEKFWPVYRQYNEDRRKIHQEYRSIREGVDMQNLTDEQSKQLLQESIELKQKEINLDKEYSRRLSEVITMQQLLKLRNAEKDFQQMLLQKIQEQRQRQEQNDKMRQRREMLRDRNN